VNVKSVEQAVKQIHHENNVCCARLDGSQRAQPVNVKSVQSESTRQIREQWNVHRVDVVERRMHNEQHVCCVHQDNSRPKDNVNRVQ